MRPPAQDVAAQIIAQNFTPCLAAFLAGSVVRGQATATSDLDLVVVREQGPVYRESRRVCDWPIEIFVHTPDSLRQFFASDCQARTPSLPQMCVEGISLISNTTWAEQIKAEAEALIAQGPAPLTEAELMAARYGICDLWDDFQGATDLWETRFIVQKLVPQALRFYLHYHRAWSGQGKWLWRCFVMKAPAHEVMRWQNALDAFYQENEAEQLKQMLWDLIVQTGGYYFEGYYQGADLVGQSAGKKRG